MRLVLLFNPNSGKGHATEVARFARRALERQGANVVQIEASGNQDGRLARELASADAAVLVGGDGTVHHAAWPLIEAQRPMYTLPLGTENLLARELGMTRSAERLILALHRWRVESIDVARAGRHRFLVMASVGPDASVIHRLAHERSGSISHLSYVRPVAQEALRCSLVPLRVEVDGRRIVDGRLGMLVVANSRQYALRMDPAPRASVRDGQLDVVFFPARTTLGVVRWMLHARMRAGESSSNPVRTRGRHIRIEALGEREAPVQLDGEAPRPNGAEPGLLHTPLEIHVEPRRLPVFMT